MNHALTALARARYRPARLSVLAPCAVAAAGSERLARDVSLRWEEAAEMFLEALRALDRGRDAGRVPDGEAGAGARRGSPGAGAGRPAARRGGGSALPGPLAAGGVEEDGAVGAGSPAAAEEDRMPGGVVARFAGGSGEVEERSWRRRPAAAGDPVEGENGRGGGADLEEDIPAEPRPPGRPAALDAPQRAAARAGEEARPLPPPRVPPPAARGAPAGRLRAEAVPGAEGPGARGAVPGALAEPWAPPVRARRGPGPRCGPSASPAGVGGVAPGPREDADPDLAPGGGLDPLALESLLEERRRRDAALEEWRETGF